MKLFVIEFKCSGSDWKDLESGDLENSFTTREAAELVIINRAKRFNLLPERYRVREQRDTISAPTVDSKIAFAAKKVPLEMIPLGELKGASRVSQYGGKKHGKGNYLKASLSDGAGERYMGALYRHTSDMQNPDGTWDAKSLAARDEESGLPHIDHAIRTLTMLRGILVKDGALPADPGEGNEPPTSPK